MKRTIYLLGMFLGMIAVAVGVWAIMQYGEYQWLYDRVIPTAGTKREGWADNFKQWAMLGILGSFGASLLWYGLERLAFRFNDWNKNYRFIWYLLLVVPLALTILSCFFTRQAQEGSGNSAYVFYMTNNFLTYYLGTSFFSPPSVMYTPVGAKYVRRW